MSPAELPSSFTTTPATAVDNKHPAGDLYVRFSIYATVGFCVLISCSICIVVFSSKGFRTKYIMFLALSIGELSNGFSLALAGTFRMVFMLQDRFFVQVPSKVCFFVTPWPIIMLFAGQFPSFLTLMIALERVLAMGFPNWYRNKWTNHHRLYLIGAAFGLTLVFITLAGVMITNDNRILKWRLCNVAETTGLAYGTTHHIFTSACYVFSLAVLLTISFKMRRGHVPTRSESRRQGMVLTITAISVTLVTIPNAAVVLNEWKIVKFGDIPLGILYSLFGIHSALSIFVYAKFRPDFRERLFRILGIKTMTTFQNLTQVTSITS